MANKEAFKKVLIEGIKLIIVKDNELRDKNIELITNWVDGMTIAEMDSFIEDYEAGKVVIPLIVPNGSKGVDYENNLDLAKKLGIKFHKKLKIVDKGVETMSPIERLVIEIPLKKPIQLLSKKRAISEHQEVKNSMTGQVTGPSKQMSASSAEVPLMLASGMNNAIRELTKYRGGDKNAELVISKLADSGVEVTQEILERFSSGPEVNNTLKQYLLSMNIEGVIGDLKK